MGMDWKDRWSETYYNAIEDGKSPEVAEKLAEEDRIDYESSLIDAAMDILKEREES